MADSTHMKQRRQSDARASKTFEDTEVILDRLNRATKGAITEVLDAVNALPEKTTASMAAAQNPSTR
jgi:hypothetical protein